MNLNINRWGSEIAAQPIAALFAMCFWWLVEEWETPKICVWRNDGKRCRISTRPNQPMCVFENCTFPNRGQTCARCAAVRACLKHALGRSEIDESLPTYWEGASGRAQHHSQVLMQCVSVFVCVFSILLFKGKSDKMVRCKGTKCHEAMVKMYFWTTFSWISRQERILFALQLIFKSSARFLASTV